MSDKYRAEWSCCSPHYPEDENFVEIGLYHLKLNYEIPKNPKYGMSKNNPHDPYDIHDYWAETYFGTLITDLKFTLSYNSKVQKFGMNGTSDMKHTYDDMSCDDCDNIDIRFQLTELYTNDYNSEVWMNIPKEYTFNVRKICLDYLKDNYIDHYNEYLNIYNVSSYLPKLIPDLNNILNEYLFTDEHTSKIVAVERYILDDYIKNKEFALAYKNNKDKKNKDNKNKNNKNNKNKNNNNQNKQTQVKLGMSIFDLWKVKK